MHNSKEIHARVVKVLSETLDRDAGAITPAAKLQADLGAESLDLLDLAFHLEREFGIRISQDELFPDQRLLCDPDFVQNGKFTERGVAELRTRMPFADFRGFERDRRLSSLPNLFTVGLVTRYVASKFADGVPVTESA